MPRIKAAWLVTFVTFTILTFRLCFGHEDCADDDICSELSSYDDDFNPSGVSLLASDPNYYPGPGGCTICLVLCKKVAGVNVPRDFDSMEHGKMLYPARPIQERFYGIQHKSSEKHACGYSSEDAHLLLQNIEKLVVNFYPRGADQMTMRSDGGYGLRMLTGQLQQIIPKMAKLESASFIHDYFISLSKKSSEMGEYVLKLANEAEERLADRSSAIAMKTIIKKPSLLHPVSDFKWKSGVIQKHFDEFDREMIGKEKEIVYPYLDFHCRFTMAYDCDVPFVCKKMYLEDIYSQYMLLHQAMYLQYAAKSGCFERNPEVFKGKEKFLDRICSKAYLEAEYLEKNGFPTRYIDLFAEQIGFCGLAGYPKFTRADWMHEVMSWQSKSDSGCFLDHYKEQKTTDAVVTVEAEMENGEKVKEDCLVHLSSVGLMALAINLRRIVDTCPLEMYANYEPTYLTVTPN